MVFFLFLFNGDNELTYAITALSPVLEGLDSGVLVKYDFVGDIGGLVGVLGITVSPSLIKLLSRVEIPTVVDGMTSMSFVLCAFFVAVAFEFSGTPCRVA